MTLLPALLIGIVAGMRTMSAPTAVSWGARLGLLDVSGTWLAFLGSALTPWIFTALAIGELIGDQLPSAPSRKTPGPFAARIVSGAISGTAIGLAAGSALPGAIAGMLGAVIGTLGGYALRMRLAKAFGKDRPAALLEDALAIGLAILAVMVGS